jgi:hypothetical protein
MPLTKAQRLRQRENRRQKRFKEKLEHGGLLPVRNGHGTVDLTAHNASRLLRGEPEDNLIISNGNNYLYQAKR